MILSKLNFKYNNIFYKHILDNFFIFKNKNMIIIYILYIYYKLNL